MELITALIILSVLAGCVRPDWVRRRQSFFLAVGATALAILSYLAAMASVAGRATDAAAFFYFFTGVFNLLAFILLVMAGTGLPTNELFQEIVATFRQPDRHRGFPVEPPAQSPPQSPPPPPHGK